MGARTHLPGPRDAAVTNYRRAQIAGGTFFFTVVTHQRRAILVDELARVALRRAFCEVRVRRPFSVDAIVLLPDHLHTVWTLPPGDDDFSTRWRQIKTLFSKRWLAAGGVEAAQSVSRQIKGERGVWQRRAYEHACRGESDWKRCVDYLHANPLKHGLVDRVRDWPWSSFHRYVRAGEYDLDWGSADAWWGDEWERVE
ncbi:MAG: transposase [Planctomycetota bacterium]